jgi:pimeloyl-ACP methyl ester carboxylesterase
MQTLPRTRCLDLSSMPIHSPFAAELAALPVRHGDVTVLGSATHYWDYGDPQASTIVVVSHGYRGEHHGLQLVIAQLPWIRFISPDLPGFGESPPLVEVPHSIDGYAVWLRDFVGALGLGGRAILLGHSFGSIISAAAIVAGLKTPKLVLMNPIAISGLKGPHPILTRLSVWYYQMAARLPERLGYALLRSWFIVRFMSVTMVKTKDRALRRWIHAEHHTYFSRFANRDVVVEAFMASISTDVSAFAASIQVPTLLLAAEKDDITPVPAQYALQKLFPNATLRMFGDVGHLMHYEDPVRAAAEIAKFLDAPNPSDLSER